MILRQDRMLQPAEGGRGLDPELLQTLDRRPRERFVGKIGERCSAPEAEGLPQQVRSAPRLFSTRILREALEAMQVELIGFESDDVSGRASLDDRFVAERLAQLGDLTLHLRDGCHRSGSRIEIVGEPVDRDDAVRVQEQDRESRALLWPAQTEWAVFPDDLERAEDAELEHAAGTVTGR